MSTLTDSDDAQRECCRDVAGTSAVTIARLTRELAEARESLAWWTEPQPCDLRHREPFDFGQCETHDRTFPLGGTCDHAGLSEVEWMEQREQEQRVRAIRAEEDRDEARAQVAAVRALHRPCECHDCRTYPACIQCGDIHPCPTIRALEAPRG